MDASRLAMLIAASIEGHANCSVKPSGAFRNWDGKTPYGIHPVWCAMTILTETSLPEDLRMRLAQALLFHDFKEDTTAPLPEGLEPGVENLIDGMTFKNSDDEMENVWTRGDEVLLGKVYDKCSNLLDGAWMSSERRAKHGAYLLSLCDKVECVYGKLNITVVARAMVSRNIAS